VWSTVVDIAETSSAPTRPPSSDAGNTASAVRQGRTDATLVAARCMRSRSGLRYSSVRSVAVVFSDFRWTCPFFSTPVQLRVLTLAVNIRHALRLPDQSDCT